MPELLISLNYYPWTMCLILLAVHLIFLASIFLGVYEKREGGMYRFRRRRFLKALGGILLFNGATAFFFLHDIQVEMIRSQSAAETSVLKNQVVTDYNLTSLLSVYGNVPGVSTKACYVNGVSSWVEAVWTNSLPDTNCETGSSGCVPGRGTQQDYDDAIRENVNPGHTVFGDRLTIAHRLDATWVIAAKLYSQLHALPALQIAGHRRADASVLSGQQIYTANCSALARASWIDPGSAFVTTPPSLCLGGCP